MGRIIIQVIAERDADDEQILLMRVTDRQTVRRVVDEGLGHALNSALSDPDHASRASEVQKVFRLGQTIEHFGLPMPG